MLTRWLGYLTIKTYRNELMIRYDPTENGHSEYEMNLARLKESAETKQSQDKKKSTKRKHDEHISETENPVSKDIYFNISDTLAESLKHKEGFSLLKAYGREKDDTSMYWKIHFYLLHYFDRIFNLLNDIYILSSLR